MQNLLRKHSLLPIALGAGLALAGCGPVGVNNLDASEMLLYGLGERHVILYGQSETSGAQLEVAGQKLEVSSRAATGPLAVPTALSVAGKPTLQLPTSAVREQFALASIPLSSDFTLTTRAGLEGVYVFDGRVWLTASGPVNADQKVRVQVARRNGLRGVGQLLDAEADALAGYLSSKGPVAVGLMPLQTAPDQALRFDPAPRNYRRTALFVQVGIPADVLGVFTGNAPLEFDVIASGGNSAYNNPQPSVRLDGSAAQLAQTWEIVGGLQVPKPAPPTVDFNRARVATVFLGQKPTGGFGIALAGARLEGNTVILEVNLREPGAGTIVTQAVTSPYLSVRVNNPNVDSVRVVNKANNQVIARAP